MDISNWANIILGIYGVGLTTYTVIKSNRAKKRVLSVSLSTGYIPRWHNGNLGPQLLLITVANPGDRKATINVPYLGLPDGKNLFTPMPLTNVKFPFRLEEGENCSIWIEMNQIKHSLLEQGYSGVVRLKGKVSDGTGKIYTSKKSWDFDLAVNYD